MKKKRTTLIQKFHSKSQNTRSNIFVLVSLILVMGLLGVFGLVTWLLSLVRGSVSAFSLIVSVTTIIYVVAYNIFAKKMYMQEIYWGRFTIRVFTVMMLWIGLGLAWIVYTNY